MIVQDKVVVVSGAGPGLGREIAKAALRDGARVTIGARNEEKLVKLAGELDPTGERIAVCASDITDPAQCDALIRTATERFGGIDAVVQVAALDALFGTLESTPRDDWNRSFEVNVIGTLQLARAAVDPLRKRGGGAIVLIGSQAMWQPQTTQIAYAAAKGALLSAMYHMSSELGPDRIRVNMVVPTWMWGPPVEAYVNFTAEKRGVPPEEVISEITSRMPLGEIPADEDVAEAVLFFCSDRSRMVTGETLMVNAGELLR